MAEVRSLQSLVFDFDGVLADTEPLHLRLFQETLEPRGITLTRANYYERYLGYDDSEVFRAIARDLGLAWPDSEVAAIVRDKSARFRAAAESHPMLFRGVAEGVSEWAAIVPVAIASGAFRDEIEIILDAAGLRRLFPVIVAAGETPRGKPAPDPYTAALDRLRAAPGLHHATPADGRPQASRSVAIEDSVWGIEAARRAGMKVVAVTTSYPAERLRDADAVVTSFEDLSLALFDDLAAR